MACCKDEIICSIIRQFSVSSPCATQMCDVIPAFWDLVLPESCGSCALTALLTKREAVLFLLGCEAYSVDQSESHYMMTAEAKADSRSDSRTQAQATGSMNKKMEAHGETQYAEKSDATSVYTSKRIGRAFENSDGDSFYRDDGRGFGFNNSQSYSFIKNRMKHDLIRQETHSRVDNQRRNDCNYEYSRNETHGDSYYLVLVSSSWTGTASEWRKFQRTSAMGIDRSAGASFAEGTENDTTLSTTRGTHRWSDTFLANIEWYEQEHIIRIHNERFDSRKVARAHSDGSGDGMHELKDESNTASQGTAQTIGDSETLRTASRVSNLTAFNITNSQRFDNLQNLYDQITEQIDHLRGRLRARSKPYIDVIPCNCQSDCCCSPQLRKRGLDAMSNCRTSTCASGSNMLRHSGVM